MPGFPTYHSWKFYMSRTSSPLKSKLVATVWFAVRTALRVLLGAKRADLLTRGLSLWKLESRVDSLRFRNTVEELANIWEIFSGEAVRDVSFSGKGRTKRPIILDIGAHIGLYSLKVASEFPNAIIFAFEPSGVNYYALEENISISRKTNIFPVKMAVSDRNGSVTLFNDPRGSGTNTIVNRISNNTEKVLAVTVDAFVRKRRLRSVDFMKIDVEGAEEAVLRGAESTIKRFRPALSVELHPFNSKGVELRVPRVLKKLGYTQLESPENEPNLVIARR
ncbi:MAG: FkbM family methyltransferase [archaeon]